MGLLLGGVLTTYANWRWVLFVNVPVSTAVLFGVSALIDNGAERVKIDLPGAITSTLGVGSLVFAVTRVGEHGWSDAIVMGSLALALLLLIAFVVIERTSKAPMIPPGVLNEGGRLGANIITFITAAGMFATFYFLTLYLQHVLGYSPLRTGLMFLPFAVGFGIAAGGLGPQLLHITSERVALSAGPVLAAGGMLWFSFLTAESSIFAVLLPASLLTGLGLGITQVVATQHRRTRHRQFRSGHRRQPAHGQQPGRWCAGPGRPGNCLLDRDPTPVDERRRTRRCADPRLQSRLPCRRRALRAQPRHRPYQHQAAGPAARLRTSS
jgi:hypothetical protein